MINNDKGYTKTFNIFSFTYDIVHLLSVYMLNHLNLVGVFIGIWPKIAHFPCQMVWGCLFIPILSSSAPIQVLDTAKMFKQFDMSSKVEYYVIHWIEVLSC